MDLSDRVCLIQEIISNDFKQQRCQHINARSHAWINTRSPWPL